MARPKNDGHLYKPGQSGNPSGGIKLPEDIKKARKLNQVEVERFMNRLLDMTKAEIKAEIKSGKLKSKELMVANIIMKSVQYGDHTRLNFLLDRLIGKVKERVEHSGMTLFTIEKRFGENAGSQVVLGAKSSEEDEDESTD